MSITPVLPLMYVQELGPTAKVASDAITRPELAQSMNKLMTEELMKQQSAQVQRTEQSNKGVGVGIKDSTEEKQEAAYYFDHKRRHGFEQENDEEDGDEGEEEQSASQAFLGKLINKKI